ncbi:MAG: hypothetical protein WCH83_08415 [Alphaproteobacteria bacterium]|jgi:hypothetical protein
MSKKTTSQPKPKPGERLEDQYGAVAIKAVMGAIGAQKPAPEKV